MKQCMHKMKVGNTTFYCVELSGHQCEHSYTVMIEDYRMAVDRAERAEEANQRLWARHLKDIDWMFEREQERDAERAENKRMRELLEKATNAHTWGDAQAFIDAALAGAGEGK